MQASPDDKPTCRICGRLVEMFDRPVVARSSDIGDTLRTRRGTEPRTITMLFDEL